MERKNSKISREVFKFPYNGNFEKNDNEIFSEKFCCCTIKVRKKIIKGIKWSIFYLEVSFSVVNGVGVIPSQAIGLPIFPTSAPKMRFTQTISQKVKIAPVTHNIDTESEIDELQQSVFNQFKKVYNVQQVINMLRAGGMDFDTAFAIGLTAAITYMMYVNRVQGFQSVHHYPPRIGEWGNFNNGGPSHVGGYGKGAGPRSITVLGAKGYTLSGDEISNSPSNVNARGQSQPSSKTFGKLMVELESQVNKKKVRVDLDGHTYELENSDYASVDQLGDRLAEQIYDSIRFSKSDVRDISKNLGFKEKNIRVIKDHVFHNKHDLDRLFPLEPIEHRRFDADLQQALAWKRLESGTHTEKDIIWLKHEYAEHHHERVHKSGYSEAHDRAQKHFNGAPWQNDD